MNSTTIPERVPATVSQPRPDGREALRFVENLAEIRLTQFSDRRVVEFIFTLDRRQGMVPDHLRKALYGLIVVVRFGNGEQWRLESETHAFRYDAILEQFILSVCAHPNFFHRDFNLLIRPQEMLLSVDGYSIRRCHQHRELSWREVTVERSDPDAWIARFDPLQAAK